MAEQEPKVHAHTDWQDRLFSLFLVVQVRFCCLRLKAVILMLPEATETLSFITTYHTGFHLQPQTKRDVLNGCTDGGGGGVNSSELSINLEEA